VTGYLTSCTDIDRYHR